MPYISPKKNIDHVTIKERKFVNEYVKSGSKKNAALVAYDTKSPTNAGRIANNVLSRERVQNYMAKVLHTAGLSDEATAEALMKIVESGTSKKALGEAKAGDALKAIDLAYKVGNKYPVEKKQVDTRVLKMNLEGKGQDELMDQLRELQKQTQEFIKMQEKYGKK